MTSLSFSACICIHAVCVGVGNEYQLAMVTFLLCSEFVNLMLLITVQYAKSDENKNAPKLGACLSESRFAAPSLCASCQNPVVQFII